VSALAEFLLARIAEDEELLNRHDRVCGGDGEVWTEEARARVLAECESKRRIVELHAPGNDVVTADDDGSDVLALWDCRECRVYRGPCRTLRALALPYAEHPDMPKDPSQPEG